MIRFKNLIIIFILAFPQATLAVIETKDKAMPVDPLSASSIINMIMGLGLVLIIIFLMAWLVRKMGGMQLTGSQKMRLLGGISLGAREKVVLIQVENKRLVLGVAQGHVSALHVLEGEYESNDDDSSIPAGAFKEKLLQALSKTNLAGTVDKSKSDQQKSVK